MKAPFNRRPLVTLSHPPRPNSPYLTAAIDTVDQIRAIRADAALRVSELETALKKQVFDLANIEDAQERYAAAAYVYWAIPEVHANDISLAVLRKKGAQHLIPLVGPVTATAQCVRCNTTIQWDVFNRSDNSFRWEYNKFMCTECHSEVSRQEAAESAKAMAREDARRARAYRVAVALEIKDDDLTYSGRGRNNCRLCGEDGYICCDWEYNGTSEQIDLCRDCSESISTDWEE